jgi:hypothetical protein
MDIFFLDIYVYFEGHQRILIKLQKEMMYIMGSIMYSDNVVDSLKYRVEHNLRRISINDLDILGHGLKKYVQRYKILFALDEGEDVLLDELSKFSELLINREYDKLIGDPSYMIETKPIERKGGL